MGSGTSTQHHFAFQNAERAFKAAALIQRWYRRYVARLEMRRRCTWSIFQSIEYAGQQDQVKLHDFFSYLMDHFIPSSHNDRDFLTRIFTEDRFAQDSEMKKCSDYESIEVPDSYTGPRLSFPLLPDHATALVEAFRLKQ
ncbi:protein phosphatase with EF-hand domain 2 [Homo sapiens]|nr:protein phosphatase with EF-hand domain 2 [Homo sapiens]KAI4025793.1 protein phosphatase with EF-hand domain 2 [Homo sapiens]